VKTNGLEILLKTVPSITASVLLRTRLDEWGRRKPVNHGSFPTFLCLEDGFDFSIALNSHDVAGIQKIHLLILEFERILSGHIPCCVENGNAVSIDLGPFQEPF